MSVAPASAQVTVDTPVGGVRVGPERGYYRDRDYDRPFESDTKIKFIKYFNLCAEEWLFWKAGYIYDSIWKAWENGMKQYGRDARVVALWQEERVSDSYYGFEFPSAAN